MDMRRAEFFSQSGEHRLSEFRKELETNFESSSIVVPRVERFFETLVGFHKGYLDLTGRHQRRYESHLRRFMAFVTDFYLVMQHATRSAYEQQVDGEVMEMTRYDFSTPSFIKGFMQKWRLSPDINEDWYATRIKKVMKALAKMPPKFQKLCLLDLPPELHYHIMRHAATEDVRRLGATCRVLREISISFIYERREVTLKFDLLRNYGGSAQLLDMSEEEARANLHQQAQDAQAKFLSEIDLLLAHEEPLRRMRSLSVKDAWISVVKERIGINAGSQGYDDYWQPILRGIEEVLRRVRLTRFQSVSFGLTPPILTALAQMGTLRRLQLNDFPSQLSVEVLATLPRMSSVVNVSWVYHRDAQDDILELLALTPCVRCLIITAFRDTPLYIPESPAGFFQRCNPFRTLERLYICEISMEDIHQFIAWIRTGASTGNGLRLTHFKLEMSRGLDRTQIVSLVDALESAPLRILALEGILYAGLDVFDCVAEKFPRLEALTLVRRENWLQTETKPCVWPHTTWEYAPHLARFQCLKYFAWNFCMEPAFATTAWDLPLMESGYPEHSIPFPSRWNDAVEEHSCFEWKCLARLFLVHCKTLEHLAFLHRTSPVLAFDIQRGLDGKIDIISHQWEMFVVLPRGLVSDVAAT
ncbi:hypothetical protein CERSUDRAFT_97948 [Gelatoporia subvermispora B]|uniref:F-box domain-containing protein n=1 Tax=Ceriporiopsis subvermispora (strain B) TaxID=914234 RepID=M2R6T9_CERS8|nr:hypothetical protein CERSUDRAFT_97948 [Gelatoporia subvermispora B]